MKALPLLAAVLIIVSPVFAEGTSSFENEGQRLAPRKLSGSMRTTRSNDSLQIADAQSVTNATWFAANQVVRTIFEYTGLYLTLGGGYAQFKTGSFGEVTPYNETLNATKTKDRVGFGRVQLCYQFDENWELSLGATKYNTAEAQINFPTFPGIRFLIAPPQYYRHSLKYDTERYSLAPTYSIEAGDYMRLRLSAGVTFNRTSSHIETLYYAWLSGPPSGLYADNLAKVKKTSWSGLASLALEYAPFKHVSFELSAAYAPFQLEIPASKIAGAPTQPTRDTARVDSLEAALSVNFRR